MKKILFTFIIANISIVTLLLIAYFSLYEPLISIELIGEKTITQEINTQYNELGAKVTGTKKKYTINGVVDTTKLATYTITYKIKHIITKTVKRKVIVVDTTPPELTLLDQDITIYENEEYKEPGYTSIDNHDKDISSNVEVINNLNNKKAGTYKIIYISTDSSNNITTKERNVIVKEKSLYQPSQTPTYINGILLVNKKYALPSTYNPGVDTTANNALKQLQQDANKAGYNIPLLSAFRSYSRQQTIYNNYVARDGYTLADTYSARPGHSEHQTGLAFDVGAIDDYYGDTPAGKWLATNSHKYGFIIRYPKGKTHITGYKYEPWHIRYIGIEHATNIYNKNITLEEYLQVS